MESERIDEIAKNAAAQSMIAFQKHRELLLSREENPQSVPAQDNSIINSLDILIENAVKIAIKECLHELRLDIR